MSETCGGNCSSCGEACSERKPESLQAQPNPKSKIGKVIAVVSGKGGVGKSTVSAMLATAMQRTGRRAGVLDADITGPSIPKAFGVSECASADEEGIYPAVTESGIQIMSVNLLLEHEDDPVLWRGPIIAGAVKQFWTDVVWENVDYLFVDMPPGTGDVPLTHGRDDACARHRPCGELQLLPLPGLRQVPSDLRQESSGRDGAGLSSAGARAPAHRPRRGGGLRCGPC